MCGRTFVTIVRKNIFCFDYLVENIFVWKKLTKESSNIPASGIIRTSDNPTYQLPNKFLFSQVFAFVDGKHHHLMEENIWLNVKKKLRQNIDSHDVTSFFPFSPHMFPQNWLLFSRHMFPQNWLLFSCHMFHQNWLIQMFGVWLILLWNNVITFNKTC